MNSAKSTALTPLSMETPSWLNSTATSSEPATPPSWNLPNWNLPIQKPIASERNSRISGDCLMASSTHVMTCPRANASVHHPRHS